MIPFACTERLLHSTAMFVAIVVAYQAYVLAMVPWIEPSLAVQSLRRPIERSRR